jgi:hypothetical protein
MQTTDKDWGRIYPNVITWLGKSAYHILSWVRFWREGKEYQLPVRMDVEGVESLEVGAKYDEQFHTRCLDIIRYGRATGDYKEPIKLNDKHVINISYDALKADEFKEDE